MQWNYYFLLLSVFGWGQLYLSCYVRNDTLLWLIHAEWFRVIRVVSFIAFHSWVADANTHLWVHYGNMYSKEEALVYGVAQHGVTSVTYMMILTVKSCSTPPSMRPISRLTDCQVGWRWTVETAVKITPLPLTLCSLQETNFVAVWLRLWDLSVFVCGYFLCFAWVQQFVHFSV